MKRRKAICLVPLSIAGSIGMAKNVFGNENFMNKTRGGQKEPLTICYTKKVQERLKWIRENQTENLMEAAYAIARTFQNGKQCYQVSWDAGHTEADSWPGRNGEPEIFSSSFNINKAEKGDLLLTSGQMQDIEKIKQKGVFIVGCPSSWSGDARYPELLRDEVRTLTLKPYADIWIENNATTLGGVIYIHGMPAPIGPVSGCVGKTTIWMMLADACRILARRGKKVPVKGDEPKVTGENQDYKSFSGWVDINKPLMDDYFNEVIKQIKLIGSELGTIRKIAKMAVDTVLDGGQIYGYSLHNSIAGEASTRRSGLAITQGIYGSNLNTEEKRRDFKGTSKDCVIMGITKPDDETDLMFLDMFKKRGMRVASLGPMTRSITAPEGRNVPDETEFHAGKMCDTYGIFAIPGFEQRICPTSGVLLDQLFWSTMMEVVEQYIKLTGGDVPGVFYSAALKGGMEHMHRMNEIYNPNWTLGLISI